MKVHPTPTINVIQQHNFPASDILFFSVIFVQIFFAIRFLMASPAASLDSIEYSVQYHLLPFLACGLACFGFCLIGIVILVDYCFELYVGANYVFANHSE
jgi:hypothetical protein